VKAEGSRCFGMDKLLRLKFAEILRTLGEREYIEAVIAFASAPTIQGKKPASLMNFNWCGKNTAELWQKYGKDICESFELEFFELKSDDYSKLILLYRKKLLEWYINHPRNQSFLNKMGYDTEASLEQKLNILKRRFENFCPHEIGIFLGMPVEDVEGFIEHKGKNCLVCKYWKVYCNPKRAELLFNAYDKARNNMAEFLVELNESRRTQCCHTYSA